MRRCRIAGPALVAAYLLWVGDGLGAAESTGRVPMPLRGATLRFQFGLEDEAPTPWDGKIALSSGEVIKLDPRPPDAGRVQARSWKLSSRWQGRGTEKQTTLTRPVMFATLDAPPTATVSVSTEQGDFSFRLADFSPGHHSTYLSSQVLVERFPLTVGITSEPTEDDWPAAARGPEGTIWLAYVAYQKGSPLDAKVIHEQRNFEALVTKGNGDQVRLMQLKASVWSAPIAVTEPGLDLWRPAVAVDGDGRVWTIWSQRVEGNWDLYARRYEPATDAWGTTQRVTTDRGADVHAVAVTHPRTGRVHVVWQGWRGESFDILLRPLDESTAAVERRLVESAANEWCPAAAFDSKGTLHVAFDTYEKGNYDVKLVSLQNGKQQITAVATSPGFEARPSIAVDKADRVWVAFEEAGANWSKDCGLRWSGRKGERPYLRRDVAVRCAANGRVDEAKGTVPAEAVTAGYPRGSVGPKRRIALPRLAFDGSGRMWLLYRRHAQAGGQGESWVSYAAYHTGEGWSSALKLLNSTNLLDNRPALVPIEGGGLLAVHSTDSRVRATQSAKQNDLQGTVLRAAGEALPSAVVAVEPVSEPVEPVHPNEAEDVRRIRDYRATIGGNTYRLLRGEFHRHTELTSHQDMDGPLEDMWRYALDAASMDWIGNGDHDNGYGIEYLWWLVQKQTDIFYHPPHFMPVFAYERSVSFPSGHRNAILPRRGIRPLPRIPGGRDLLMGTPEEGSPDIKTFYAYLHYFEGICASHTSGTGMGTDWRDNDPDVEPIVEIFQGCRQSYEHEGAPGTAKNAKDSIGGYQPAGFVWNALKKGYRLGFQSSSDHYSAHISYAVVFAEAPTREAILDAFKKRHCYAAQDNIILDVRCGDHLMGDSFTWKGKPRIAIRARGTQPIARASIIRGAGKGQPRYVYDSEPGNKQVDFTWTDEAPEWGTVSYYYVRVEQERPKEGAGALAWGSPMWITPQR